MPGSRLGAREASMQSPVEITSAAVVDDAIARVLAAEQAARQAVLQVSRDADAVRERARSRARAIAERAAGRVARVHQWTDATIQARVGAIDGQLGALRHGAASNAPESTLLAQALDQLVADLVEGIE
jgi:hypothetical protein